MNIKIEKLPGATDNHIYELSTSLVDIIFKYNIFKSKVIGGQTVWHCYFEGTNTKKFVSDLIGTAFTEQYAIDIAKEHFTRSIEEMPTVDMCRR